MATGTKTYEGLAIPLYGEFTVKGQTAADDIMTVQGATAQTGDYLVIRNASQTEGVVVEDGFNVVITQAAAGDVGLKILRASTPTADALKIADNGDGTTKAFIITKNYNPVLRRYTTRPTTGLVKNELMLLYHNSTPKLGVCISTAAQTIKLIRLRTKSFGRLTA